MQTGSGSQLVSTSRGYSVINPFLMANVDPYAIDRAARLHRNAAGMKLWVYYILYNNVAQPFMC